MDPLKVFIGSSSESKACAQLIQEILQDLDPEVQVFGWWREDVFAPGDTHIESLDDAIKKTTAAILVFADDDRVEKRGVEEWATRDNVLLEYGMFAAAHGRRSTMLAVLGTPGIPTDLLGLNTVPIEQCETSAEFKEKNRGEIRRWLEAVRRQRGEVPTPETVLPNLYRAMLAVIGAAKEIRPDAAIQMDYMAAELLNAMATSLRTSNMGVDDELAEAIAKWHLHDTVSISAYEVTGPASWVNPAIFRYLSDQIRRYLWANIIGDRWHLLVSDWLGAAIHRSIDNARKHLNSASFTIFDNPKDFHWEVGTPRLQYSRILFWTKEELSHQIADSVIAIHETFNIPLFFVEARPDLADQEVAFIAFEKSSGEISGRYGFRRFDYKTRELERGSIPGSGEAMTMYRSLLEREDIMFAKDAKKLLTL